MSKSLAFRDFIKVLTALNDFNPYDPVLTASTLAARPYLSFHLDLARLKASFKSLIA
jgi:hypothetical protein